MQRPRREGVDSAPRTRSQSRHHTVDVIVLTADSGLLATLREAAGIGHQFFHAASIEASVELLLGGHCGIFIIDVAIVGNELARLTEKLQAQFPEVVLLATGRRNEQNSIASLVSSGRIYRFLHKPVSPARAELFLSAATRRYGELHQHESRTAASAGLLATSQKRTALIAVGVVIAALGVTWALHSSRTPEQQIVQPMADEALSLEDPNAGPIKDVLLTARAQYQAGNVLPPAANNAFDLYRAVLRLDPDNADALASTDRIIADVHQQVTAAIAAQNAPRATIALTNLRKVAPRHPRLGTLQAALNSLARRSETARIPVPQAQETPATASATTSPQPPATTASTSNLDIAKAYLAANQLIEPIDASALSQLRQARAADEDEGAIQIAATDLGTRLLNRALVAIAADDAVEAKKAFDAAASLDREFETSLPDIDAVGARVRELDAASERSKVANERLARITRLRTSGQLIEPSGDNAYELLKGVLAEEPLTPEVRNEQQRLSFALLESTRTALAAGDIDQADVLATRAEEIQPALPQTKSLREQIGVARAERDNRNAVVQAASLPRRREIAAVYPREALLGNVAGWVDLEFVITAEGVPTNIAVKAAEPARVFDTAATQALRQWRFEPIMRNGVPQSRRATLRMEFKLKN